MLELATNHLLSANLELTKALELLAPDREVMERLADIKNQIRRVMAQLDEKEVVA